MSTLPSTQIADIPAGRLFEIPADQALAPSRWLAVSILLLSDLAALFVAAAASVLGWYYVEGVLDPAFYLGLWPVLVFFVMTYSSAGLYPGFGRNPVEELRKLCISTSLVYPALAVTTFLLKHAEPYSRAVFLLAWVQSLIMVPLLRALVRRLFARKSWWGYPILIMGQEETATTVLDTLRRQPELGLKPIALMRDGHYVQESFEGVAVFDNLTRATAFAKSRKVHHVIVAVPEASRQKMMDLFTHYSDLFSHVIIIPNLSGLSSLGVEATDLSGLLGLQIRQSLLIPAAQLTKSLIDLFLTVAIGTLTLPLFVLIAALIKATSRGPIFYGQTRYGRGGRRFVAWKFRSMVLNAREALDGYLQSDASIREQWEHGQKLKDDPRITRVGRFLRKTSLDELPQLWNVLRGEMSLVGPRPIIREEIQRYGDYFTIYKKVTPGLTGLWQISGRNNLPYQQRINLDLYYVRNWSVWLDLYILVRTVKVVLCGDGAY